MFVWSLGRTTLSTLLTDSTSITSFRDLSFNKGSLSIIKIIFACFVGQHRPPTRNKLLLQYNLTTLFNRPRKNFLSNLANNWWMSGVRSSSSQFWWGTFPIAFRSRSSPSTMIRLANNFFVLNLSMMMGLKCTWLDGFVELRLAYEIPN